MIETMVACSLVGLVAVLLAVGTPNGERLTRRAWTRLAILGAAGLSLMPGCLTGTQRDGGAVADEGGTEPGGKRSARERWARLGRIWRELTAHYKGDRGDHQTGKAAFDDLKTEMAEALDALPAWLELRAVFEERWAHIDNSRYPLASCYMMMLGGMLAARRTVEDQVDTLQQLIQEGKLTEEAALKASGVLAVQAEYMARDAEAGAIEDKEARWDAEVKVRDEYDAGKIEAGPQAELAGKRLAELTVDNLGWLVGVVRENEGTPADDGQTEDGEEATE
jgi:hypothetical protein